MRIEDFNFDEMYEEVLLARQKRNEEQRANYQVQLNTISPSQLGFCQRKQIMDTMGLQGTPDVNLLKIFDYGNLIHDEFAYGVFKEYFEEVLHIKNVIVINEYPFKNPIEVDGDDVYIKGFVDDLIISVDDGQSVFTPIEIKSIGNAYFKLKEPKAEHQIQLHMYLRELKADFGYIVYIHKGTLSSKTFKIERNEAIEKKLEERVKSIYRYKRDGSIPPAEAMINSKDYWFKNACDNCSHLSFCLQADKGEIKNE